MKLAVVLAGGGSKGAYQVGAWRALRELGVSYDIVTGTSIGSVTAALMVQNDYARAERLWRTVTADKIMNHGIDLRHDLDYYIEHRDKLMPFLRDYASFRGADIAPYRAQLESELDEAAFFASPVDFALMTARFPSLQPVEVRKAEIRPGYLRQWILASSSCFPIFPVCDVDGQGYIDGAYADNLPIGSAFRLGAERVIAIGLKPGVSEKKYAHHPLVTYIEPSRPIGTLLDFDAAAIERNLQLGYLDTMRVLGGWLGGTYTFLPENRALLEAAARRYLLWLLRRELVLPETAVGSMLERFTGATPLTERILEHQMGGLLACACAGLDCAMEALDYRTEEAYDARALLPELRRALLLDAESPALTKARSLCAALGREHFMAQIAPVVPMYSDEELFLATLLLYLQERDPTQQNG